MITGAGVGSDLGGRLDEADGAVEYCVDASDGIGGGEADAYIGLHTLLSASA